MTCGRASGSDGAVWQARGVSEESTDQLYVTRAGGVATLWLNRPEKRNAITHQMWRGIGDLANELATDDTVRVLVVRGVGDHFCAGADIGGLSQMPLRDYHDNNHHADTSLAAFPKPSIAFISGSCIGGGAEIAASCDLRLATEDTKFGITPAKLGIVYPGYALERVTRLIGPAATKYLLFTGDIVDAGRAHEMGFVDELLAADAAEDRLASLCATLTERSLLTQVGTKEMVEAIVRDGSVSPELMARWQSEVDASPDLAEGIAAFAERRAPSFSWVPRGRSRS